MPVAVVWSESPQSVLVSYHVSADQALVVDVAFDVLELWTDPEIISADNFEFGDTRNWSLTGF